MSILGTGILIVCYGNASNMCGCRICVGVAGWSATASVDESGPAGTRATGARSAGARATGQYLSHLIITPAW